MPTFYADLQPGSPPWWGPCGGEDAPVDAALREGLDEPSDAVRIWFYLQSDDLTRYQSKEAIMAALKETVEQGEIPWLVFRDGRWVFDLDAVRAFFPQLHDYDEHEIGGSRSLRPLLKETSSTSHGRTYYYNHLEFTLPLGQATTQADLRELEQKFGILFSARQELKDFNEWTSDGEIHDVSVAFLFADIDHFKALNTKHTETTIDASLLPAIQQLLERLVRHRGYAYRHGGEEFVILLPNHNVDEATAFAEKVRQAVAVEDFLVSEQVERVTVSIGVALFPENGNMFEDALLAANLAKQEAKDGGRNRVVVRPARVQATVAEPRG